MIDRAIHHIWVSAAGAALPAEFERYRRSWIDRHPTWSFRLWGLRDLDFPLLRPELLAQACSYAQVADVLRLEILYRHGGLYVDTDFECFRAIDALLGDADLVLCSENAVVISNSILGCRAGSPVLRDLLAGLPDRLGVQPPNVETGPGYLTRQLLSSGFGARVAMLPSRKFYPYWAGQPRVTAQDAGGAYAAHHWAHSWSSGSASRSLHRRLLDRVGCAARRDRCSDQGSSRSCLRRHGSALRAATVQALKTSLSRFPLLVSAKRRLWRSLRLNRVLRVYRDAGFFEEQFRHGTGRSAESMDTRRGVVRGEFMGVEYLLTMRPCSLIETDVYLYGLWEPHVARLIASFLQPPGRIVIDVGANVGATTIPLAKRFPDARFHLFEPHALVFEMLQTNCRINRLANVTLTRGAVTDSGARRVKFYAQASGANLGLSGLRRNSDIGACDEVEVDGVRLDDALEELDGEIAVIKIDTQGTELQVLQSALRTLERHRPVVVFEFESDYFCGPREEAQAKAGLRELFGALNYQLFALSHFSAFMPALTLDGYYRGNVLALPAHQ